MEYNTKLQIGATISLFGVMGYPLILLLYYFLTGIKRPEFGGIVAGFALLTVFIGFLIMVLVEE